MGIGHGPGEKEETFANFELIYFFVGVLFAHPPKVKDFKAIKTFNSLHSISY